MTYTARSPQGAYSIVLPGTWAEVPLDDGDVMRERVKALVLQRVGRNDRLARVRKDARDELVRTAERARTAGATAFWMSLEVLPGIPLPAALIVSDRAWPAEGSGGPDLAGPDLAARLMAARPGAEILDHRSGPVARTSEIGEDAIGELREPSLFLEYSVPYPHGEGLLSITVSAPTVHDPELYTVFFDAIVDSLTWAEPAPTSEEISR
ncbi:hypothetical protein [Leifsonia poae]|uniref:hypothetical protein n=1 Tax=Leifsonia poae TaxID=110933 RepID=UPI001CBEC82E|nr:hypothetical protein [Leifsonia poae]